MQPQCLDQHHVGELLCHQTATRLRIKQFLPHPVQLRAREVRGGKIQKSRDRLFHRSFEEGGKQVPQGRAAGRFASLLHRRQKQGHQDADDRDDDEEFDERESGTGRTHWILRMRRRNQLTGKVDPVYSMAASVATARAPCT